MEARVGAELAEKVGELLIIPHEFGKLRGLVRKADDLALIGCLQPRCLLCAGREIPRQIRSRR